MARDNSLIEACYWGEKFFLQKRGHYWIGWWHHRDFQFSDGYPYESPEAALAAIQAIVRKSRAVRLLGTVLAEWLQDGKISVPEMDRLQLSLMAFLG
ncbi:MAG: hypothetical protein ACKO5P_01765 [Nodosilinea sp.]